VPEHETDTTDCPPHCSSQIDLLKMNTLAAFDSKAAD
jgi:hypothetical protein